MGTALLLASMVLGGCSLHAAASSSSASSSPVSSPANQLTTSATASSGTATQRCTTDELSGRLLPGSPGAGQRYATLVLTNTSDRTCSVFGYGGVGLADADGSPLPTHQVRVSDPAPQRVTVRPGGTTGSQLHWSAVPGNGDSTSGQCQPTPATLRVIPPDETTALSVPWSQGPVCEAGTIEQQAYAG